MFPLLNRTEDLARSLLGTFFLIKYSLTFWVPPSPSGLNRSPGRTFRRISGNWRVSLSKKATICPVFLRSGRSSIPLFENRRISPVSFIQMNRRRTLIYLWETVFVEIDIFKSKHILVASCLKCRWFLWLNPIIFVIDARSSIHSWVSLFRQNTISAQTIQYLNILVNYKFIDNLERLKY